MQKRHGHLAGISMLTLALVLFAAPAMAQEAAATTELAVDDGTTEGGTVLDLAVTAPDLALEAAGFDAATLRRAAAVQGGGRSWYVGVRGGAYFDVDEPFLGVELLFPLVDRLWFNPNFEWVFVDPADLYSINLDVHYDLPTDGPYMFWLGAGLALTRFDPPGRIEADTDPGLNLLAGMGFGRTGLIPYVQGKFVIDDNDSEFVLAGGIRF